MPCNNIDSVPLDASKKYIKRFLLQQQYKDIQSSSLRTNTTVVNVHDEEEGQCLIISNFMNVQYNVNVKDLDWAIS